MEEKLIFYPGLYWRGIRITKPAFSVDILPGLYIIPFGANLIVVFANIKYLQVAKGVRWVCWHRWLPRLFPRD